LVVFGGILRVFSEFWRRVWTEIRDQRSGIRGQGAEGGPGTEGLGTGGTRQSTMLAMRRFASLYAPVGDGLRKGRAEGARARRAILNIFVFRQVAQGGMDAKDISLNFRCPTCGVAPGKECEMLSGALRFGSHVERCDIAQDDLRQLKVRFRWVLGSGSGHKGLETLEEKTIE